jgi:hypothetical protein
MINFLFYIQERDFEDQKENEVVEKIEKIVKIFLKV